MVKKGTSIDNAKSTLQTKFDESNIRENKIKSTPEIIFLKSENERKRLEYAQKAGRIGTYDWDLVTNKSI